MATSRTNKERPAVPRERARDEHLPHPVPAPLPFTIEDLWDRRVSRSVAKEQGALALAAKGEV